MLLEFGNHDRHEGTGADDRPAVTYMRIADHQSFDPSLDAADLRAHHAECLAYNRGIVTQMPEHQAATLVTHPLTGLWQAQATAPPKWVWSDTPGAAEFFSDYYQCPVGRPGMLEELYWRHEGKVMAPGVVHGAVIDLDMELQTTGRSQWGFAYGLYVTAGTDGGTTGTATATSSTSLTATGTPWTAHAWTGYVVVCGGVFANIVDNSTSVLYLDQWYALPETGTAGSTPGGTSVYSILPGGRTVAWYIALNQASGTFSPAYADTHLPAEATTNAMGRVLGSGTFTAGSGATGANFTVGNAFHFSGSSSTTFNGLGLHNSAVVGPYTGTGGAGSTYGNTMIFETAYTPFSVATSSDVATVTDTITSS